MLSMDAGSLERVRQRVQSKLMVAAEAAAAKAESLSGEVAMEARRNWPVATGESRDQVHAIRGRWEGDRFETGVAVGATRNGQEIRIERGNMNVHSTMAEHDPGGRKCSAGDAGGWGAGDEPVNVREEMGNRLEANPSARRRPLLAAIVNRCGDVVNGGAGLGFRKGIRNVYPAAWGLFAKVKDELAAAVRAGLTKG